MNACATRRPALEDHTAAEATQPPTHHKVFSAHAQLVVTNNVNDEVTCKQPESVRREERQREIRFAIPSGKYFCIDC